MKHSVDIKHYPFPATFILTHLCCPYNKGVMATRMAQAQQQNQFIKIDMVITPAECKICQQ